MTTIAVLLITLPLIGFAMFVAGLTGFVWRAATSPPPADRLLVSVAKLLLAVTIGVGLGALLGIQSVVYNVFELRLLPPPLPTIAIYVAVIAPSVGAIPLYRYVRARKA